MKKENNIPSIRMLELEQWLKDNENKTLTLSEYLNILTSMTEEEREYLIIAKNIPLQEIDEAIEYYDSHKFPVQIDELAFVNNLMRKYSTDRLTIIKRIKQARMIKQAKKQEIKVKNRKK